MAQQWKSTPQVFNGSPDNTKTEPANYESINFSKIGLPMVDENVLCYENAEGHFGLEPEEDGLWIFAANSNYGNRVVLRVTGVDSESVDPHGGSDGDYLVVRSHNPVSKVQAKHTSRSTRLTACAE